MKSGYYKGLCCQRSRSLQFHRVINPSTDKTINTSKRLIWTFHRSHQERLSCVRKRSTDKNKNNDDQKKTRVCSWKTQRGRICLVEKLSVVIRTRQLHRQKLAIGTSFEHVSPTSCVPRSQHKRLSTESNLTCNDPDRIRLFPIRWKFSAHILRTLKPLRWRKWQ